MRFAMTDDADFPPAETAERPLVPAGTHTMSIVHAEEGPNEYKRADENPEGLCLKLRLGTDGGHKFVFDDLPQHLPWRAKQLAAALAIVPAGQDLDLDPSELVGQKVTVEITHYTSKAGKVSAVVKRYVPAAAPVSKPASKPASRRSNLAAVQAALPDDDIPF